MNEFHRPAVGRARTRRARPRRASAGAMAAASVAMVAMVAAGCATFSDSQARFSPGAALTPAVATVIAPEPGAGTQQPPAAPPSATTTGPTATAATGTTAGATDPCAPPQPPVVAVCLDNPWGLAPLPSGSAALVGERTTGRVLMVAAGSRPQLVATVTGLATADGGGLLGLALSPYYDEDGLAYAYVTTRTDARVLRIAPGQDPKPIVTGLPAGGAFPGGALAFDAAGMLYVATGSPAPEVVRFDTFGTPAGMTSRTGATTAASGADATPPDTAGGADLGNAVFATGLTDPTGMCVLPDGRIGVVDHRTSGDVVIGLTAGRDYRVLRSGDAVWTFAAGSNGAIDCTIASQALVTTSRSRPGAQSVTTRGDGAFSGAPTDPVGDAYGYLHTAATGPGGLAWFTTANKPGDEPAGSHAAPRPNPSDDRVIVVAASQAGGGLD